VHMQPTINDSANPTIIGSTRHIADDLDFLAANLHGKKSRIAEGERLDSLCRIQNLQELYNNIFPDSEFEGIIDFQRQLIIRLIAEISGFCAYMSGAREELINWTLIRFQVENLKILVRSILTDVPIKQRYEFLIPLPKTLSVDVDRLGSSESLEEFVHHMPKGPLRQNLSKAVKIYSDYHRPFFFEAALDCGYFEGLLAKTKKLPNEDREIIEKMIFQEVDIFHLMLVARGRFYYKLPTEVLQPLHIDGTRITRALFFDMLHDSDPVASIGRASDRVLDSEPFGNETDDGTKTINIPAIEGQAWGHFLRLSNNAFRRSHMGMGTIMGYIGIRRIEVANLITISECIRKKMPVDAIRTRLIPRNSFEVAYV